MAYSEKLSDFRILEKYEVYFKKKVNIVFALALPKSKDHNSVTSL